MPPAKLTQGATWDRGHPSLNQVMGVCVWDARPHGAGQRERHSGGGADNHTGVSGPDSRGPQCWAAGPKASA